MAYTYQILYPVASGTSRDMAEKELDDQTKSGSRAVSAVLAGTVKDGWIITLTKRTVG